MYQFLTFFFIDIYVECEFKSKQQATKELETMQFLYKLVKKASLHFNFRYVPGNIMKLKLNSI